MHAPDGPAKRRRPNGNHDRFYFEAYEDLGIHESMLKDNTRTQGYCDAIMGNCEIFKDKTVIDVGCGTGILSIFCARAGAKRVYAIEASNMAQYAKQIVADNHLSEVITVVHSRVEDCDLKDDQGQPIEAAVIVSEWMGYFLFYESMFESVLLARDRWLAKDGAMFPSHAAVYLCPFSDDNYYAERVTFWKDVYGVNMSALTDLARKNFFQAPLVEELHPLQCCAFPQLVKFIDCKTCSLAEVQAYECDFEFTCTVCANLHGFVGYFDVFFCADYDEKTQSSSSPSLPKNQYTTPLENFSVDSTRTKLSTQSQALFDRLRNRHPLHSVYRLSTSPEATPTHWQQTLFFTGDHLPIVQDQCVRGRVCVEQAKDVSKRYLNITLHWTIDPPPQQTDDSSNGHQTHGEQEAHVGTGEIPAHEAENTPLLEGLKHSRTFKFH
eukprot:TRINITY_DN63492_c0_g1_i1.p1 TRINITY_DN63492_c0_g1~~TRINITY_DN63492_c0_g1_i1.p1  ORF type:complete len:438 (+),score=34.15 TRINITY_DN63492_c0_g1_i1:33-1346(+)